MTSSSEHKHHGSSDLPSTISVSTKQLLALVLAFSLLSVVFNLMAFAKIDALQASVNNVSSVVAGLKSTGSGGVVVAPSGGSDGGSGDSAIEAPPAPSEGTAAAAVTPPEIGDDPVLGVADAPLTIIEFSDFECPFCGRFYSQTLSRIKTDYIDTGKVKLVYKDFPLSFHPDALPAALAANCVGKQDSSKYWSMHDSIFEAQGSDNFNAAGFRAMAESLGVDMTAFDSCLVDPETKAEIDADTAEGVAAGIRGTPGFYVGDQLISGAQPFSVFQAAIDAQLPAN